MSRRNIQLPVDELVARYKAGESTWAIGRAYGVSHETVRHRLLDAGVKMRTRGEAGGGQLGNKSRLGWYRRGGPLYTGSSRYLSTYDREGKGQLVHRGCWEAHHGAIPCGHDIHHINGSILDNCIENLACMPHAEHRRLHCQKEAPDDSAL